MQLSLFGNCHVPDVVFNDGIYQEQGIHALEGDREVNKWSL
jgi:hypothetical protein